MNDVKWIKICTNIISNKKIKRIRKLPEGNNIVLIWVFLLAEAGESNRHGGLFMTDTIPFTVEDLAIEFDFDKDVITLALKVLERYDMVEVFDEVIYIKNWEKYQNVMSLDKIRDDTAKRVARHREKRKMLMLSEDVEISTDVTTLPQDDVTLHNVTSNINVTPCNATEEEEEEEEERPCGTDAKISRKRKGPDRSIRNTIPPTVDMVKEYCQERKNNIDAEEFVDFYISRGWMVGRTRMVDWQATIRTWEKDPRRKAQQYQEKKSTVRRVEAKW